MDSPELLVQINFREFRWLGLPRYSDLYALKPNTNIKIKSPLHVMCKCPNEISDWCDINWFGRQQIICTTEF